MSMVLDLSTIDPVPRLSNEKKVDVCSVNSSSNPIKGSGILNSTINLLGKAGIELHYPG